MLTTGFPAPTWQDRLRTAQEFIATNRLDEAEALLNDIRIVANDPDILNVKATLALARRRTEFAFEMLAEAATLYPEHSGLVTNLGIAHELLGRFDEAVICLERASALVPHNEDIKLALAHALLCRGDITQARAITQGALKHEPANARAFLQLGAIDLALRDYPSAEAALLRALELTPDDPDTLRNMSVLLLEQSRFDEALSFAERAHLRAPLDTAGLLHLAYCRAATGLWLQAEAACKKLLAYAPTLLGAREILARVTIANGEVDRGITELTQFVRTHKSDLSAALVLARTLQFVGRFNDALTLASHVAHACPDDETASCLKTTLELTLGRFPTPEPVALALVTLVFVPPTTCMLEFVALVRLVGRLASQQGVRVVAEPHYRAVLTSLAEQVISEEPKSGLSTTPLQSLLRILAIDAHNIADGIPYLRPDSGLFAKWRDALARFARPLVGIVWDGGVLGLTMEQIAATLPHSITPISLMTDAQRHNMKRWSRPIDAGVHIDSPAELIAAIANLDAVIGPDSFAVHIAGSLGVPGVVFVPNGYPWYWAQGSGKPLWYPSFEVVVQEGLGNWSGVIDEGRRRLAALLHAHAID
ncbi:tetratricopeptide repeat protein [Bradyrhizobium sp. CCGUVB1N3]|uniref:tetratricopeptide repeat protein n=1 Tax=Bradyrhizobium sp. CCGUVB1N3 TaxID=2949629 RepID=UPI0020B39C66|nr:tetratricopeptide repeat protein [Bradyrhizobium sp. CCGUVB1N3]MCP3475672.1 tetratricopeptide repeat protein [Bradyrhizobium sp. CCGUVB1N3]